MRPIITGILALTITGLLPPPILRVQTRAFDVGAQQCASNIHAALNTGTSDAILTQDGLSGACSHAGLTITHSPASSTMYAVTAETVRSE